MDSECNIVESVNYLRRFLELANTEDELKQYLLASTNIYTPAIPEMTILQKSYSNEDNLETNIINETFVKTPISSSSKECSLYRQEKQSEQPNTFFKPSLFINKVQSTNRTLESEVLKSISARTEQKEEEIEIFSSRLQPYNKSRTAIVPYLLYRRKNTNLQIEREYHLNAENAEYNYTSFDKLEHYHNKESSESVMEITNNNKFLPTLTTAENSLFSIMPSREELISSREEEEKPNLELREIITLNEESRHEECSTEAEEVCRLQSLHSIEDWTNIDAKNKIVPRNCEPLLVDNSSNNSIISINNIIRKNSSNNNSNNDISNNSNMDNDIALPEFNKNAQAAKSAVEDVNDNNVKLLQHCINNTNYANNTNDKSIEYKETNEHCGKVESAICNEEDIKGDISEEIQSCEDEQLLRNDVDIQIFLKDKSHSQDKSFFCNSEDELVVCNKHEHATLLPKVNSKLEKEIEITNTFNEVQTKQRLPEEEELLLLSSSSSPSSEEASLAIPLPSYLPTREKEKETDYESIANKSTSEMQSSARRKEELLNKPSQTNLTVADTKNLIIASIVDNDKKNNDNNNNNNNNSSDNSMIYTNDSKALLSTVNKKRETALDNKSDKTTVDERELLAHELIHSEYRTEEHYNNCEEVISNDKISATREKQEPLLLLPKEGQENVEDVNYTIQILPHAAEIRSEQQLFDQHTLSQLWKYLSQGSILLKHVCLNRKPHKRLFRMQNVKCYLNGNKAIIPHLIWRIATRRELRRINKYRLELRNECFNEEETLQHSNEVNNNSTYNQSKSVSAYTFCSTTNPFISERLLNLTTLTRCEELTEEMLHNTTDSLSKLFAIRNGNVVDNHWHLVSSHMCAIWTFTTRTLAITFCNEHDRALWQRAMQYIAWRNERLFNEIQFN